MREQRQKSVREGTVRPRYLTASRTAANDGSSLVVLRLDELLDAIRAAVSETTGQPDPNSRLLDRERLAERLCCSISTVDQLRRDGMPCLYVGDSPRFVYEAVLAWMSEQQPKESA